MTDRSFLDANFHSIVQGIMRQEGIKEVDAYSLVTEDGLFVKYHICNVANMPPLVLHFEGRAIHSLFPAHVCTDILFHIRMASRKGKPVSTIYEYKSQPGMVFNIVASCYCTPFFLDSKRILAGFFLVLNAGRSLRSKNDFSPLSVMPQEKRFHSYRARLVYSILAGDVSLSSNAQEILRNFKISEATSLCTGFICEPLHENSSIWNDNHSEEYLLLLHAWQNHAVEYLNREMQIFSWCYSEGVAFFSPLVKEDFVYPNSRDETFEIGEDILEALHYLFPGKKLALGIAEKPCVLSEIHVTLEQAHRAAYGSLFGLSGKIFHYHDLGYGIFINQKHREQSVFAEEVLHPLFPQEGEKFELLLTLEALLERNSLAEAAKRMHVHINTMVYRKKQIEEILMVDLNDKRTRVNLFLSIKLWKFHHILKLHEKSMNYCRSFEESVSEEIFSCENSSCMSK